MTLARTAVRYGYVPFMLFGLNGLAYYLVTHGYSYAWMAPILALALLCAFVAERIAPWFPEWNGARPDDVTNAWHLAIYELSSVNGVLLMPLIAWLFPNVGLWPTHWPVWAQLVMAFAIADFSFMVVHYFSHKYPVLWRLHAVHHGVGRLYGFNGVVRHPIHQTIDMVIGTAPLAIAGMPVPVAVLLGLAISIALIVQHSNVQAKLGPLEDWLAIGKHHHLHHVNWGTEGDCNFGMLFGGWDRLFGTFRKVPSRPITATDMGVDEVPDFPRTYWQQLLFPFQYTPGQGWPPKAATNAEPSGGPGAGSSAAAVARREVGRREAAE